MSNNQKLELIKVNPLNKYQQAVLESNKNLLVHGCAGTGKTFILLYKALRLLDNNKIDKIIILRSAVATRDIGFLPGRMENKMKVFEEPYEDIVDKLHAQSKAYAALKKLKKIEFRPSSFVRGITFENCFVLVDEFQNMSEHELHSIMTRLGQNTSVAFSGDSDQTDLYKGSIGNFTEIIKGIPNMFDYVEFDVEYVVRSKLVREYLKARKQYYNEKSNSSPKNIP